MSFSRPLAAEGLNMKCFRRSEPKPERLREFSLYDMNHLKDGAPPLRGIVHGKLMEMSRFSGYLVSHHVREVCQAPCPIHAPSQHGMVDWPLYWRSDFGMFERLCPHGIGHWDPDSLAFTGVHAIHGCDGCCKKVS